MLEHANLLADQFGRPEHVLGVKNIGRNKLAFGVLDHDYIALAVQNRGRLAAALKRVDQRIQHVLLGNGRASDDGFDDGLLQRGHASLYAFCGFQAGSVAAIGLKPGLYISLADRSSFR